MNHVYLSRRFSAPHGSDSRLLGDVALDKRLSEKKNIGDKTRQTRRRPSAQLAHSSTILSLASCASGPTRTSLVPFLCIVSLKIRVDLDPDHRHPVLMCVCVLNKIKCCSHAGRLVLYAQIIKSPHFTLYSINHHTLVCSLQNLMKVF